MLKIAVTTIEAFRNYQNGTIELEDFLKRVRGEFTPSRYMDLGSAFHDILENIEIRYNKELNIFKAKNGLEFEYDIIAQCYEKIVSDAPFEVKITKIYDTGKENIEVVAKVDQLYGNYVIENKTCWGMFDFERYFSSCQWKFYLDIFEAERVFYNVFCLSDKKDGIELRNIEQFSFNAYPDLMDDLNELMKDLVEFIHAKNLEEFFAPDYRYKEQRPLPVYSEIKQQIQSINDEEESTMNIQKIKIANLLGIEELEFDPGKFTLIEGKNGSGKTSILESIKHALNGGHDAKLLRNGSDKGEIVLVLDDGVQLTKTVTPNKSDVKIFDKDGNRINKPQTYIDRLIDMLSVNPVQFLTSDKKNRVNYLLEAIPMKLTKDHLEKSLNGMSGRVRDDLNGHALEVIGRIYKQFYDERTGVNRALKEKSATMTQLKESVSDFNSSPKEITDKIKVLENKKGDMESKKSMFMEQAVRNRMKKLDDEEERFREEVNRLRLEHEENKEAIHNHFDSQKTDIQSKFEEKYLPLLSELTLLQEQAKQYASHEKTRELVEQFHRECQNLKEESEKLSGALTGLDNLKEDLLRELPIQGLEIKEGEIYCKDIIFDKLNTAEQVKIAVEVAKLRANELGIICVDGIERLDNDTFNEFKHKAIESGLQMIVTKVGDSELRIQSEMVA
jgi:energy-coupling factor transporter ATP-binding protein EcfA2